MVKPFYTRLILIYYLSHTFYAADLRFELRSTWNLLKIWRDAAPDNFRSPKYRIVVVLMV